MSPDNIIYIYTLTEEGDDNNVRYVGKTTDVQRRYFEHLCDTGNSHKAHWIQSLRAIDRKPVIKVVETLTNPTEEEWQFSERFWINLYKCQGCILTNLDEGGIGGGPRSEVTKERIAAAQRGRTFTEEHRQKLAEANRRPERIADTIKRNKERVWTEESKQRSSNSHKGRKVTPEQKEHQSAAVKAWWAERRANGYIPKTKPSTLKSMRKKTVLDSL